MIIALAQLVVILALVVILVIRERDHERQAANLFAHADHERHALLNRIQHPQVYRPEPVEVPVPETRSTPADVPMDGFELAGREVPNEQYADLKHLFDDMIDAGEPVTP